MPLPLKLSMLAVTLLLVGCSAEVGIGEEGVDSADLEAEVSEQLAATVGQTPKSVDCPDRLPAEVGAEVRCTITAEDDTEIGVTVTATAVEDGEVQMDIEVDDEVQS